MYKYNYSEFLLANWIIEDLEEYIPLLNDAECSIMARIALKDFYNYLKVKNGLVGEWGSDFKLEKFLNRLIGEKPWVLKNILDEWIESWIIKWRQRVKIVWSEDKSLVEGEKLFFSTENIWNNLSRKDILMDFVIGSLIRIGEYCFTNLIAESILRKEISRYMNYIRDSEKLLDFLEKNPIVLLNDAIRDVNMIKNFKGQTVVMKVDKKLFKIPTKKLAERPREKKSWIWKWKFFKGFW